MEEPCIYCCEAKLNVGDKTDYGAIIIYKIGGRENGWFATLSPKTGGDSSKDFTIQLMPIQHINHVSEINDNSELAKNYGLSFSKISHAMNKIMKEEERSKENEEKIIRIGIYGKSKHPNEHFHIKIFPWVGDIGQPYTVDSSFENKEIFKDEEGREYIRMIPVKKMIIKRERLNYLASRLIKICNNF